MHRTILRRPTALAAGLLVLQACGDDQPDPGSQSNTLPGAEDTGGTAGEPTTTPNPSNGDDTSTGGPLTSTSLDTGDATSTTTTESTGDTGDTTVDASSTEHVDDATGMTTEPAPTCEDGEKNQDESDIDCGGGICSPCVDGSVCAQNSDCAINSCVNNVCHAPACDDTLKNGDETDVDCGGPCPACADNLGCLGPDDCVSAVCTDGVCTPANCGDGIQNGSESDVDCGGDMCDACPGGLQCELDDDCLSQLCTGGVCEATECLVDSDCDAFDGACTQGDCVTPGFTCQAVPVNDGQACEDGNLCVSGTVCGGGTCGGGTAVDCSVLTDQCNVGACNPDNGQCVPNPLGPETSCFESTCTGNKTCGDGVCGDPNDKPFVFYEDFSDNTAGWTLDPEWAIGVTKTSTCGTTGSDPASDHTPTTDNQVAGVVLGGCYATTAHDYYCLTSPKIDTSGVAGAAHLSYWRWLVSDYANYAVNKVDVFDGNTAAWVNLFTSGATSINDAGWKFFSHDVSAYKHISFQARFCFKTTSGVFARPGWNLDDLTVGPNTCGP